MASHPDARGSPTLRNSLESSSSENNPQPDVSFSRIQDEVAIQVPFPETNFRSVHRLLKKRFAREKSVHDPGTGPHLFGNGQRLQILVSFSGLQHQYTPYLPVRYRLLTPFPSVNVVWCCFGNLVAKHNITGEHGKPSTRYKQNKPISQAEVNAIIPRYDGHAPWPNPSLTRARIARGPNCDRPSRP